MPSGSVPSCTAAARVSANCFIQNGFSVASAVATTCVRTAVCSCTKTERPAASAEVILFSISRSLASSGLSRSLSDGAASADAPRPVTGEKKPMGSEISPSCPGTCGQSIGRHASPNRTRDPIYTWPFLAPASRTLVSTSATTLSYANTSWPMPVVPAGKTPGCGASMLFHLVSGPNCF